MDVFENICARLQLQAYTCTGKEVRGACFEEFAE